MLAMEMGQTSLSAAKGGRSSDLMFEDASYPYSPFKQGTDDQICKKRNKMQFENGRNQRNYFQDPQEIIHLQQSQNHQQQPPDLHIYSQQIHQILQNPIIYSQSNLKNFRIKDVEELTWKLLDLRDEGNFDEYLRAFVKLVFPIERLFEFCNEEVILKELLQLFVGGLREEFISYMNKSKPTTLFEAMDLAIFYEEMLQGKAKEGDQTAAAKVVAEEIKFEVIQGVEEFSVNDYMKKLDEEKDYDEEVIQERRNLISQDTNLVDDQHSKDKILEIINQLESISLRLATLSIEVQPPPNLKPSVFHHTAVKGGCKSPTTAAMELMCERLQPVEYDSSQGNMHDHREAIEVYYPEVAKEGVAQPNIAIEVERKTILKEISHQRASEDHQLQVNIAPQPSWENHHVEEDATVETEGVMKAEGVMKQLNFLVLNNYMLNLDRKTNEVEDTKVLIAMSEIVKHALLFELVSKNLQEDEWSMETSHEPMSWEVVSTPRPPPEPPPSLSHAQGQGTLPKCFHRWRLATGRHPYSPIHQQGKVHTYMYRGEMMHSKWENINLIIIGFIGIEHSNMGSQHDRQQPFHGGQTTYEPQHSHIHFIKQMELNIAKTGEDCIKEHNIKQLADDRPPSKPPWMKKTQVMVMGKATTTTKHHDREEATESWEEESLKRSWLFLARSRDEIEFKEGDLMESSPEFITLRH